MTQSAFIDQLKRSNLDDTTDLLFATIFMEKHGWLKGTAGQADRVVHSLAAFIYLGLHGKEMVPLAMSVEAALYALQKDLKSPGTIPAFIHNYTIVQDNLEEITRRQIALARIVSLFSYHKLAGTLKDLAGTLKLVGGGRYLIGDKIQDIAKESNLNNVPTDIINNLVEKMHSNDDFFVPWVPFRDTSTKGVLIGKTFTYPEKVRGINTQLDDTELDNEW